MRSRSPLLFSLLPLINAQLTPSPTYQPPPAESGTIDTNSSTPNTQYSNLLGNLLYFYEAQRTGELPSTNRVDWRNNSVLTDGQDWNLDLTRGYFDAGDYSLQSFNLAGTLFSICWGATIYGPGYDAGNQTAYLDQMLRWGLDWAMRAHPSPDTIFGAIGNPATSGTYWGGDQNIPAPRPSYPINATHPGTDLASAFSSMFSMCSLLYSPSTRLNITTDAAPPTGIANATYAGLLRTHAEDAYGFAMNNTRELYGVSVPQAGAAYNSSTFGDDLTLAGLSLGLLTNNSAYYTEALSNYANYSLSTMGDVFNWDAFEPVVFQVLVETALARPSLAQGAGVAVNLTGWQGQMEGYLDRIVAGTGREYLTNGRLLWWPGDSNAAGLNPALNAAYLFTRYAPLATTSTKRNQYQTLALEQLDYALGKNPLNAVYVVGSHPNSIKNPHSAPASGGDNLATINTVPEVMAHVIYGAVVGGPDAEDRFYDIRNDYPQTEVALDYNAPILSLVAHQLMNGTSDPYFSRLQAGTYTATPGQPCDEAYPCGGEDGDGGGSGGLSTGAKIAIGVVVPLAVLTIFFLGLWFWKKRKGKRY